MEQTQKIISNILLQITLKFMIKTKLMKLVNIKFM